MPKYTHYQRDIVVQVLVPQKSKALVYAVLKEFIPEYIKLDTQYASRIDDPDNIFQSEDEMISYFIDRPNVDVCFYWNQYHNNPDKIMAGVSITTDNQMVFSLTVDGTLETEKLYRHRLKQFLQSNISVVTYIDPAEYEDGEDFKQRYG